MYLDFIDLNIFSNYLQVIVEKDNQVYLYCKGGDTKIKERLANSEYEIMNQTDEHLNNFANDSLSTLCLAWKQLDRSEYEQWAAKLSVAV
jgi:phospholipid-translocating ATPase